MMMIISLNSHAHTGEKEREEVEGEYGRECYVGMVQPSQQHVAPCVKVVEWGLGTRGLRIVEAFWAGIPVSSA